MKLALQILLCELVGLIAPLVTLVYRKGWFNTPDNPDSPHGMYEPAMKAKHAKWGTYWADWWWLGIRNRAYGLRYSLKPEFFKSLDTYERLSIKTRYLIASRYLNLREINVAGYKEWTLWCCFFHVIVGHRLRPIRDEFVNNMYLEPSMQIPFREVNMDARPIFSIRGGQDT